MKIRIIAKVLGMLLIFFSLSMLTPLLVSHYFDNGDDFPFLLAFGITLLTGLCLWVPTHRVHAELQPRDGFLIVFLIWLVLGIFGSLPFYLSYSPHVDFSSAFFETISGLTTTGATTLAQIDGIPECVLYYRQQLQFLGGMGIIVLAVAIMPLIGVGGMQLYKAETSGPMKENKLTPHITETAKALWLIYVLLNVICLMCYWLNGMSFFDALCYAFATISTGGFATHTDSFAYYHGVPIEILASFFMILGGTNFSLHFVALNRRSLAGYWKNPEFRLFIRILVIVSTIIAITLIYQQQASSTVTGIVHAWFQTVSFSTSTGFVSDLHYSAWPVFVPNLLLLTGLIGACAGSTTGGIKIIRVLLMRRQIQREIKRLVHPQGVFPLKIGQQVISHHIMSSVWSFVSAYIAIIAILWLMLQATGLDVWSAYTAVVSCIANTGPGFGMLSDSFGHLSPIAKWILSFAMLAGRLEIFTVLVVFSRSFWSQ